MRKSNFFRNVLSVAASLFVVSAVFAQPSNDDCTGATDFGSLNAPSNACLGGLQNGTVSTMSGQSTVGATGVNPYTYLTNCSGVGGDMASPALDTWYSFTATGTTANIDISGFPNASVGVWEGPCSSLTGRGCMNVGAGGAGTLVITQVTIGATYYVQISGGTAAATDNNFTLSIDNDIDCDDCLRASTFTSSPNPVNGAYTPGQVVTFCYTVTEWEQENTNWFHGVQITFGAGWTGAITNPVPAATCDGSTGVWTWFPAGIAGNPDPGFYFDGDLFNNPDGNPATNFGDNCQGTGLSWTFCFDLTVAACSPGADLGVTINTTGDGETGSWTSNGCNDDAETVSSAYMICCDPPLTTTTPTTCAGDSDGALTVTGQGGQAPYDYVWEDAGGTILLTDNNNAGASALGGLAAGTYTVTVTDNLGCVQVVDVVVVDGPPCPPCFISSFFASIGSCEAGSVFTVTGDFQYDNNPGNVGVVTVTVTNGSGSYTQTFNPPFVNLTTYNFSIGGIPADGTPLTVTVVFSNDLACTATINSTSPASCACDADIGTFSTATTGSQAGNDFTLCWGQTIDITANGDYTPPAEAFSPPGPAYTPGIGWLVYSCPPTIALIPNLLTTVPMDPCLEFIIPGPDLNDFNDQFYLNQAILNGGSIPVNNTLYWVPITLYCSTCSPMIYSYVNTAMPCYETGPVYSVTYLDDVTETSVEDCTAGTVTTAVTGGQPALDGSLFTGQNLLPATASFSPGTAISGGEIVVTGLVDGDAYSYDIVDANGCLITISGVFVGLEDPAFTYPSAAYCIDAANPSPTINGDTGGAFTSTAGLSINSVTGQINLAASAAGTYTVTYTTPDPICFASTTFVITINPLPIVDGNDETICPGDMVTLNGTGADTYTWNLGVVDGGAFSPAVTTTYTVTGTITATGCSNTGTATVTVLPLDIATFTTTDFCFGSASPAATVTGLAGGTFALNPLPGDGATINATTGSIINGQSGATYTVEYTTNGPCPQSSTQTVTVNPLPIVVANDVSVCVGGNVNITASGATTYFWDNGLGAGQTHNVSPAVTTNYIVTGTDANGCVNTDLMTVTVLLSAPINAGPDVTICAGDPTTLTATGGVSYTWLAPISATGAIQVVSPAGTTIYTVNGVDAAGCSGTDQVTVTINPLPTATITGTTSVCIGDPSPTITFTGANGTAPYTFTYTLNGGANQTVTSVGTSATVSVPTGTAGTFSYDLVSVQDASSTNCSQVQVGNATVVVNPLPTATIAGSVNLCVGDPAATITFTGANGTAPYTFTYTLNGGANQTITSVGTTATISVPTGTAGTFSYDLVSVQDASSTTCSQLQAGNATVVVNPLPTATIAGTTNVCVGDAAPTITFTGANGTAPYTFTYTLNGGANQTITSVGTTATITVATGAAGTFSYDLVSVQDASSTTCSQLQVGNATVVVNPLPTATIAGDITLCVNDVDPVVTFTGAAGTAPYTFTYTLNGGPNQTIISVGSTATIANSTAVAGTFVYELVSVQDASATGCSQAQTGTVTIVVSPLPTATISGTISVCEGGPDQTITFTGANGIAPYTFGYTLNGGAPQTVTSIGSTVTITVSAAVAGVFTYDLLGVQDSGLSGCYQAQGGTAIVTVNALPVVSAGNDFVVCEGSQAILTGSGALIYVWTGGVIDGQSFTPTTTGPYTVTGTDANGCVNTDDVIVTVEPLPVVSFIGDVLSGCASEPLVVTFTNTTPGTLVDCIWTLEDGTILTGCGTVTHTFSTPGTFDVTLTVTSANGCVNSVTYVDYIYVEGDPNASFIPSESVISNLNPTVLFENTSTGAVNYLWDFGDNSGTSTVVSPDHSFPEDASGSYAVMLVAYSPLGCTDTALATIQLNEEVIFYVPNTFTPDDDDYNPTFQPVFTSGFDPYDFTLLIFNRWGEIIFESHNAAIGWDGTYGGNLVQDGTYIWKIEFKTTANDERKVIHGNVNILK
jgi:gliding motility-associated-like protein